MIILGINGFEDFNPSTVRHIYSSSSKGSEDILGFSEDKLPLQLFPLHLIGHDCSAALLVDGKLAAFGAEERFTRVKHGFNLAGRTVLPRNAINYCLREAGISWSDVDYIAHYCHFTEESVKQRFENVAQALDPTHRSLLEAEYRRAYENRLAKHIILQQLEKISGRAIPGDRFIPVKHHLAHAAGTFFSSNFQRALILTLDGYGEVESSIWATGEHNMISPGGAIELPTSLGLLYQIITTFLGFRSFGDEYKVMGLASYGNPGPFMPVFNDLIRFSDGVYTIRNLSRVDLLSRLKDMFGELPPGGEFSQRKADIAAALQKKLEETLLYMLTSLRKKYDRENLCISGGVALNACANGEILRSGLFDHIFIQPAASDDGTSLGAALYVQNCVLGHKDRQPIAHAFWGPSYGQEEIEKALVKYEDKITWGRVDNVEEMAADLLAQGKIIGWFKGRMEMGPRALGARSILADPRSGEMRDKINKKLKDRESFRPFAPIVLQHEAPKFFDIPEGLSAPYMLMIFNTHARQRELIPAVVHVDGTSRLQTVTEDNPGFYKVLRGFQERTGIPILLNTSFNRAGEPIVNTPEDALKCFLKCRMDALVMEDYLIYPNSR